MPRLGSRARKQTPLLSSLSDVCVAGCADDCRIHHGDSVIIAGDRLMPRLASGYMLENELPPEFDVPSMDDLAARL